MKAKQPKPEPDVLYQIRARIDSGASRGAPQLNKDVRVLKKAEQEIVKLRARVAELEGKQNDNVHRAEPQQSLLDADDNSPTRR